MGRRLAARWGVGTFTILCAGCIASVSADPTRVLRNPDDPTQTLATTPSTEAVCGTICDALIASYGVPANLKDACVFECAGGFAKVPDACYELVACVANHTLCTQADISPACAAKAGDCFAQWSLANGSCRGCWQPSRTVHGKQIVTFLSEGTPSEDPRPEDFSKDTIAALLPGGGTVPYTFPGTGNADGSYTIPNVPGCGVWVQVGTTYTWAGNADVDTSYPFPGRRNPVYGGPGTTYEIQLVNMVPWTQNDWVEFFVPQLGDFNGGFWDIDPSAGNVIPDNATSFLWSYGAETAALMDPTQHDVIYFADLPTTTRPDGTLVRTIKRAARVDDFTPKDGVQNPVTANLVDVPATRTVHIDYAQSTFDAFAADLHPASLAAFNDAGEARAPLDIWTHPGRPAVGANAELVYIENPGTADIAPFDVSFGTPYGADWGIDAAVRHTWHVKLAGRAGGAFNGVEFIETAWPLDRQGNSRYVARLGPPRNIRVNGQPFSNRQTGGTLTPRFDWDPPAVGAPNEYQVEIFQMADATTNAQGVLVSTFVIPTFAGAKEPAIRSFVLLPGILASGKDYYFRVSSLDTSDERGDSAIVVTAEYWP